MFTLYENALTDAAYSSDLKYHTKCMGPTLVCWCHYCLTVIIGRHDGTADGRKLTDKKVCAYRAMMFIHDVLRKSVNLMKSYLAGDRTWTCYHKPYKMRKKDGQ
jgi:hypothetical protein